MTAWQHIGLDAALAILETWVGRPVIVSVDLAAGPPGLAGMAGTLRQTDGPPTAGRAAAGFEVEGSEAWFCLPSGPCFRGATYTPASNVLVLEYADEACEPGTGVLVDVQLLGRRAAGGRHQSRGGALYAEEIVATPSPS